MTVSVIEVINLASIHKIWPYFYFSDTVTYWKPPESALLADTSSLIFAISHSMEPFTVKLFEQWQGVPIVNSTLSVTSQIDMSSVISALPGGVLQITPVHVEQVGSYVLNFTNDLNLPDPTNTNSSVITYYTEAPVSIKSKPKTYYRL